MSKVTEYLNEHILGEVTHSPAILDRFSRDGSVLSLKPEIVVFPRNTNDIRKTARFCWQLAEKGHLLSVTTRGFGGDATGASIGSGVILNTTAHLDQIINLPTKDKQKLVHVQPGISCYALNQVLYYHGQTIPVFPESSRYSSVGAVIANGSRGPMSGKYGGIENYVDKLEVVLANGDVIETGRMSKKEFSKLIGLQTFEADIYRKIDSLIEDYEEHIQTELSYHPYGNAGYGGIADVKNKDGSFDLTPLFIGSQGTLGIISEIIFRTDELRQESTRAVIATESFEQARDIADQIKKLDPSILEIVDGRLYELAKSKGKQYPFFNGPDDDFSFGAVIYVEFDDIKEHKRRKKLKSMTKFLGEYRTNVYTSDDTEDTSLDAMRSVMSSLLLSSADGDSLPPIIDGASISDIRQEEFLMELKKLEAKHHSKLLVRINVLDDTFFVRTPLDLTKIVDKQKMFKLIGDYAVVVESCKGSFVYDSAEGRLKANASTITMDDTSLEIFAQIKDIFDPYNILNSGVKQDSSLKDMVAMLRSSYDVADKANLAPGT